MPKVKINVTLDVDMIPMGDNSVIFALPVQQLAEPLIPHVEGVLGPQIDLVAGIAISNDQQSFLIELRPKQGAQPKL